MKLETILLAASIPALLLLRPADEVAFAPREGARLTKTFKVELEINLDDMEVTINGESPPGGIPEIESTTNVTVQTTVTDTYVAARDGRATELRRTFDELSSDTETSVKNPFQGSQDFEVGASSELEGKTVVFKWNGESEEYDVSFAEDDADADEELLVDLAEDMDLRAFLPGRPVSEGDSWQVEPARLVSVLAPGGDLKMIPEELPGGMEMPGNDLGLADQLGDLEGSCTATYRGVREVGGRRAGVIALSIDVKSTKDITELMMEAAEANKPEGMGFEQEIQSADVESEFKLEGELLWDLEAGTLLSLDLSGESSSIMDIAATISAMGDEMEAEQAIYLSGEMRITVEVARE